MAPKKQEDAATQAAATAPDPAVTAPADPQPATELDGASGAVIEPAILGAVDLGHPSADDNPREGTVAEQNNIDWNDPKRVSPQADEFAGQGLDMSVYGKGAKD
ncbi:hypothetical protein [Paracoccus laeviglucosivorans]|uniref:Uncharacterized protein n=1 Tax=Paracoccus laeviglucosivorans TaxID=1197861 RepID=A0A521E688_9RHOB|nr:hypothetical protein [Paracoccus laeviglucosivorans]SMO78911.1 hypothetical protein SAMN06265221_11157 [Paracoccus laeviglucosivorans]